MLGTGCIRNLFVLSLLCVFADSTASAAERPRTSVVMENGSVRATFTVDGDLRLSSIEDKTAGGHVEFKDKVLWQVFARRTDTGVQLNVNPGTHPSTFSHAYTDHGTYQELVAEWSGIILDGNDSIPSVKVTAALQQDAVLLQMRIEVDSQFTDYSLYRVFFPDMYVLPIGGVGTDDFLAYPLFGGYIIDDPVNNMRPFGAPHPGWISMQFFSLYDTSGRLYFGTNDEEAYVKVFSMTGNAAENALYWRLENLPENHTLPGADYAMPYDFVIGVFQGDWFDAAEFYREWALDRIVTRKPIADPESDFSKSLRDADAAVTYNIGHGLMGLNATMLQGMKDSKTFYGVDKAVYTIYRWTVEEELDASYPEVTPLPNLAPGIQTLLADSDLVTLYVQIAYDDTLASYLANNIEFYTIKNLDGSVYKTGNLTRPDPFMVWSQDFARDWTLDLTLDLDLDGCYWDYWSGLNHLDYDSNHGHPLGGGNYHVQGKLVQAQKTLDALRQEPGKEEWFLTSEYVNEFFVDVNELEMWNRDGWKESLGETPRIRIPLYETVFGDRQFVWTVSQTLTIDEPGWDEMLCCWSASLLNLGMMMGYNGTFLDPYEPGSTPYGNLSHQFLGKLIRAQMASREYTLWGRPRRNVHVSSVGSKNYDDIVVVPMDDTVHIYPFTPSFPAVSYVITSVWEAHGGAGVERSLALVLANWHQSPQPIQYTFLFGDYGLQKGRPYHLMTLDENGRRKHVDFVKDDFTRTDTLPGRSVLIYVLEPAVRKKKLEGTAPLQPW